MGEATVKYISSAENALVKQIVKLQLKKRERDSSKLFVIEGFRENQRALEAGVKLKSLIFCRDWFLKESNFELIELAEKNGGGIVEVSKSIFAKLSYRDRPDGFIALAKQPEVGLEHLKLSEDSVLVVVERIEKPGNLGTLLRGLDATGADGLIVCEPVTDIFNPNVVRASTGALFSVPVAVVKSTEEVITWLRENGVRIFSTTPHTENVYWDCDFKLKQPIAIVAGAEQYGLSETWVKESDELVKLPMLGAADSLNIAVSTITCLYEVLRQRAF